MNGRDWLSVILMDQGIPLHLVADKPVTIHGSLSDLTTLEFTLRIRLSNEEFANYAKVTK